MPTKIYIEKPFNDKHWIQPQTLIKPSFLYHIKYYLIGIFSNEIHKYNYSEFRSLIEV